MAHSVLEHANITVSDIARTSAMLCDLFGWHVRWKGAAIHGGTSWHVGADDSYLAIYSNHGTDPGGNSYQTVGAMNHLGIVVDDLDAVEARVIAAGFAPFNHADYDPGRRFYFRDQDGIEFEVISYRPIPIYPIPI